MKHKHKLKRKQIRMLLDAANHAHLTTACLVRCVHFPGHQFALMSVESAIEHQLTCKPEHIATSITEIELAAAHANGKNR